MIVRLEAANDWLLIVSMKHQNVPFLVFTQRLVVCNLDWPDTLVIRRRNIMNSSSKHLFIGAINANHAPFEGGLMILILFIFICSGDLHLSFLGLFFVGGSCWAPTDLDVLFFFKLHLNFFLLFWFFLWILFNHCLSIEVPNVYLSYWNVLLFELCESLIQFFSVEIAFFEWCPCQFSVTVTVGSYLRGCPSHIDDWWRLTWRKRWKNLRWNRVIIVISSFVDICTLNLGEGKESVKKARGMSANHWTWRQGFLVASSNIRRRCVFSHQKWLRACSITVKVLLNIECLRSLFFWRCI